MDKRIKKMRVLRGLTQTELARKLGTTKQNIYKYENGIVTNIPSNKVEDIAHALNTTPQYLMGWEDDPIDYETWAEENSPPKNFLEEELDTYERARAWYKVVNESDYYGQLEVNPQQVSLDNLSKRLSNERREFAIKFLEALCLIDDKHFNKVKTIIEVTLEMN